MIFVLASLFRRSLEPLSRAELLALHAKLDGPMVGWTRTKEAAFAGAGLTRDATDEALLDAMVAHPILMERPILIRGQEARVGRPPESVLTLL